MRKFLSLILAVTFVFSCFTGITINVSAATESRLNLNTEYGYSYPSYKAIEGDNNGVNLTDGKLDTVATFTPKNETFTWNAAEYAGKGHDLFDEGIDPHYYVNNDFGFVSKVNKVELTFTTDGGAVLPQKIDIFITNDGYNYYIYPKQTITQKQSGNKTTYTVTFNEEVKAMGVKAYVYTELDMKSSLCELSVIGIPNENERILLSKGAKYQWTKGNTIAGFNSDTEGTLLTDGEVAKLDKAEKFVGKTAAGRDDVSLSTVSEINMDLGEVKNVSEVQLISMMTSTMPKLADYIIVRYSEDGFAYYDLGQSYELGHWGHYYTSLGEFSVMRNHTVKARYIKVLIKGPAIISEVEVYGSENPIEEMDYGFTERNDLKAHTNVAEKGSITVGGASVSALTDLNYTSGGSILSANAQKEVIVTLNETVNDVNGVMLYFLKDAQNEVPASIETYISENGTTYTKVEDEFIIHETAGKVVYRQYFNDGAAKKVKFVIKTNNAKQATLLELGVYADQPQLPIYRGGFISLYALDSSKEQVDQKNTEYRWYLLLKGMRETGMDYVVLQAGAEYESKMSLITGPKLNAKGYVSGVGLGCEDPIKAILEAADKLGMKVFLGTVLCGLGHNEMKAKGIPYMKEIAAVGRDVVDDALLKYGDYKSFYGFYLTDETCDYWLGNGSVDLYRTLYKEQTDYIYKVAPEKKTMICPAIWRSYLSLAESTMYNLVKPDKAGDRPVVDIVAAQDCLGRNSAFPGNDFYVGDKIFNTYEEFSQAWAKAVRRAGAEYG